jgi:hypothetical protein
MDQSTLEALLGRPLTPIEVANLDLYIELATEYTQDLLCITLADVTETRIFDTRKGYSTAYLDIFRSISEVKINDSVVSDYSIRQWDKRTASWYNSIISDSKFNSDDEVEVTAVWGFAETSGADSNLPLDLQALLAGMFGLISKKNKSDGSVSSKQTEDFRITFNNDNDLDDDFYTKYRSTISKYSLCNMPNVQHGGC